MPSFFGNVKHQFQTVRDDGKIETKPFLDACSEIIPFFDILGSTAFAPVKSDIRGNVTKLTNKYELSPKQFETLQDIVKSEIEANSTKAKNSATDALLWLKRALSFIRVFLQEVLTGEQDLVVCAKKAYESSLKAYHGWMVQSIFNLAMKAVPYRKDFIKALGEDCSEEEVLKDMAIALNLMAQNIDNLNAFYTESGQDVQSKV